MQLIDTIEKIANGSKDTPTVMSIGAAVGNIIIGSQLIKEKSNNMKSNKMDQAIRFLKKAGRVCFLEYIAMTINNRCITNVMQGEDLNLRTLKQQNYGNKCTSLLLDLTINYYLH